ncbi:GFA family protein [Sphingopyxis sp.]|uniref:GFA family protein n=1 Tax=Sphingopyxis sp. TaxID=1908224 RepID=UPI003BA9FCC0
MSESKSYTGGCACGAVTYRIDGDPMAVRQCWCRHCQKLSTGGPTHNAFFMADAIAVDGTLASNAHAADSGNELSWYFCASCGTQLFGASSARPQMRAVRLGSLDQAHELQPTAAIWVQEAPGWVRIDPAMEQHPAQPPAPPPQNQS